MFSFGNFLGQYLAYVGTWSNISYIILNVSQDYEINGMVACDTGVKLYSILILY